MNPIHKIDDSKFFFPNFIEMEDSPPSATNKRPQFGNRFLEDEDDVFKHNAWDNVDWDKQQEQNARDVVQKNSQMKLSEDEVKKYEEEADKYWDSFYDIHQNRFFKDRHWLFTEFPELAPNVNAPERVYDNKTSGGSKELSIHAEKLPLQGETGQSSQEGKEVSSQEEVKNGKIRQIFELGCGVGNTILPILKYSQERNLMVYGCDFSPKAIEILRENPEFDSNRCEVFVMDATERDWTVPFEENSIDIIVLIFVLSAIHPDKMKSVAENCYKYLKPGGLLVLRDYGRYDMAQLRFKAGKCLQESFYVRGDGTRVYFFTQDEIRNLFEGIGLIQEQNIVDRRLQVNRGRMLKMYRVWIQTKFRKPS